MSTVKTTTPASKEKATVKATTTKAVATKTVATKEKAAPAKPAAKAKTATAKTPAVKADAKVKTPKAPAEKKERKSRKGITRSFAEDVTAAVSPVMATVTAFITNPETSEDALKMIRLELRKAVKATRGTIKTRKVSAK